MAHNRNIAKPLTSISFKNFKKYTDFPSFIFGGTTIIVGQNNAGKSTLTKATMIALHNILNIKAENDDILNGPTFYFTGDDNIDNICLGNFNRVLNNNAQSKEIEFCVRLMQYDIVLKIIPLWHTPVAKISSIKVLDNVRGVQFLIDFVQKKMHADFNLIDYKPNRFFEVHPEIEQVIKEIKEKEMLVDGLQETDLAVYDTVTANSVKDTIAKEKSILEELKHKYKNLTIFDAPIVNSLENVEPSKRHTYTTFASYIENFGWYKVEKTIPFNEDEYWDEEDMYQDDDDCSEWPDLTEDMPDEEEMLVPNPKWNETVEQNNEIIERVRSIVFDIASELDDIIGHIGINYIPAHYTSKKSLYRADDTDDYSSRVIAEFASRDDYEEWLTDEDLDMSGVCSWPNCDHDFIVSWMESFGVGKNYKIDCINGDSYMMAIEIAERSWVNLADLGRGANQLMVMLLKLATIMSESRRDGKQHLIVIEEPEQNLHPALQSKLADFFFELNRDYGLIFLIETHSEYLIRRTQVIVSELNRKSETHFPSKSKSAFKVYYFPSDGMPYDMVYRKNGFFTEKFGPGFFDEAGKIHLTLLKNSKDDNDD